jgi:hypothetical protein
MRVGIIGDRFTSCNVDGPQDCQHRALRTDGQPANDGRSRPGCRRLSDRLHRPVRVGREIRSPKADRDACDEPYRDCPGDVHIRVDDLHDHEAARNHKDAGGQDPAAQRPQWSIQGRRLRERARRRSRGSTPGCPPRPPEAAVCRRPPASKCRQTQSWRRWSPRTNRTDPPHARGVADIVAHVVSDHIGVARDILRDAGFHLAYQVRAHIGRFDTDATTHPGKEGDRAGPERVARARGHGRWGVGDLAHDQPDDA